MANELQTTLDNILNDKNTNLLPENIKEGITCLGIKGTYKGTDTSDATAAPEDILLNRTAYVNDNKITGTMKEIEPFTEQEVSSIYSSDTGIIIRNSTTEPFCLRPNARYVSCK